MDRIEEVERQLVERLCERNGWDFPSGNADCADYDNAVSEVKWFLAQPEIRQPFEPPDEPDEGRFITEKELPWLYNFTVTKGNIYSILEAQRDLTASIKEAECQERAESRLLEIEEHFFTEDSNGWLTLKDTLPPTESTVNWWQALKKQEGINE